MLNHIEILSVRILVTLICLSINHRLCIINPKIVLLNQRTELYMRFHTETKYFINMDKRCLVHIIFTTIVGYDCVV